MILKDSNRSKKKIAIQNLFFNYSNTLFAIVNGLVLLPLYLKHFSVSTYGSFLSSGNIIGMLGLLEGGVSLVITQKLAVAKSKNDLSLFSKIIGSTLFVTFGTFLIILTISLGIYPFISDWVKAEPLEAENIQIAFVLSALSAGIGILYSSIAGIFQALLKVEVPGISNLIAVIIGVITTLLSLHLGFGIISIPLGLLVKGTIGATILTVILFIFLKKNGYPIISFDKLIIKDIIRTSIPLFGTNTAKSLMTNSQLLIITNLISPAAAAIYTITNRIFQVCDSLLAPIGSSIFSSISHLLGEGNISKIRSNIVNIFTLFSIFSSFILACSFSINQSFISLLVGEDKFGGTILSLLLCISMFLYTRFSFLNFNLYALGIFKKTVMYDLAGLLLKILILFVLVPITGLISFPLAEIISNLIIGGIFINSLMIKAISLKQKDMLNFAISGLFSFTLSMSAAYVWQIQIKNVTNTFHFMIYSSIISILIAIILAIINAHIFKTYKYLFVGKLRFLMASARKL